jgi:hypothetical protein
MRLSQGPLEGKYLLWTDYDQGMPRTFVPVKGVSKAVASIPTAPNPSVRNGGTSSWLHYDNGRVPLCELVSRYRFGNKVNKILNPKLFHQI